MQMLATETSPIDSLTPEARHHWVRLMTLMAIADGKLHDEECNLIIERARETGLACPTSRQELEHETSSLMQTVLRIGIDETMALSLKHLRKSAPPQIRVTLRSMLRDVSLCGGIETVRQRELWSVVNNVWSDVN